jgi:hypothetical protein
MVPRPKIVLTGMLFLLPSQPIRIFSVARVWGEEWLHLDENGSLFASSWRTGARHIALNKLGYSTETGKPWRHP